MNNEELRELTYEDFGLTVDIDPNTAKLLVRLKQAAGCPSLASTVRYAIAEACKMRDLRLGVEERPLVSIGQGEYRRDIMEGDV
jgi:hypothetical protein